MKNGAVPETISKNSEATDIKVNAQHEHITVQELSYTCKHVVYFSIWLMIVISEESYVK
jgi:hypothetical protein